ncbi:MAG TPA: sigma 54-interacting transcriptional regulator [Kofleriaceae bacterium]|jgi:DNA-binding NtrC family response regulator|nr:sigma 54-interacting transcriptional regulator [Kofleriaceae bacterium]
MRDASPGFVDSARAPAMRPVIDLAQRAARSSAHVLITGESGAGKRSLARWIHAAGPRAAGPLIAISSAALGDALLAGQSAAQAHAVFRDAAGGTLVIDELAELPYEAQAALVQLLDQRLDAPALRPDGPDGARVIATTRHAARDMLRADLYYAIAVIAIAVPPLRERAADIPALVARFLARQGRTARITDAALAHLAAARWPGNVRELEAAIERAIALSDDGRDDPVDDPVNDPVNDPVIDVAQLAGVAPAPATSPDHRGRRSFPR